jgi:hypothetical protein
MTSKDLSLQKYYKAKIFLYKNITKQRFFFTKTWQTKDLSSQKYGKVKYYLYKNMTKQRFIVTKI